MAASEPLQSGPSQGDLDRCVHCGLCLNACPTYRELGLEMDSPRGRIYQMNRVASGLATIGPSYVRHIELCLACRACESACPSGVRYGRMVEAARAQIEASTRRPWAARLLRWAAFHVILPSRAGLRAAAAAMWAYRSLGLREAVRVSGILRRLGRLERMETLAPPAEFPTFFRNYGRVFPAEGERRRRVALLGGCIANVAFARLNEASVRVLRKNGCEVSVPAGQTCCGALHLHSGLVGAARKLARRNLDAFLDQGFDAVVTNAAGCGSTLKEYPLLFEDDPALERRAAGFSAGVRDITEFLAGLDLNTRLAPLEAVVTYQDSCHLLHGQRIKEAPRKLLRSIPGLTLREMSTPEICCGSAGIYNVVEEEMAAEVLASKMAAVNRTGAQVIATANPGCILQLRAGVARHGRGQRVAHVVELLDEAYRAASAAP